MPQTVYVSITGLKVKHLWQVPLFWRHAVAAMSQARSAAGCMQAEAHTINGIHHTLSVWTDRDAMLAYIRSGAHLKAMQIFHRITTGKTIGFEARDVPDWTQVHAIWTEQGRSV